MLAQILKVVRADAVRKPLVRGVRARGEHRLAWALIILMAAPQAWSQGSIDERPNAFAMTGDLLVARPIGAAMTLVGAAAFVISLPFTAMAGSIGESAETLVLGPAETTFVRCLGCLEPGYSYKDAERRKGRDEFRVSEEAEDGE